MQMGLRVGKSDPYILQQIYDSRSAHMIFGISKKIGKFANKVRRVKTERRVSPWVAELRRQRASGEVDAGKMFITAQKVLMPEFNDSEQKPSAQDEISDILHAMAKRWRLLRQEVREKEYQIKDDLAFLFNIEFVGKVGGTMTVWDTVVFWSTRQMGTWQDGGEAVENAVNVLRALAETSEDMGCGEIFSQEYTTFLLGHKSLVLGLGVAALKAIWLFAKENGDNRLLMFSLLCLWRQVGGDEPPPGLPANCRGLEDFGYIREIVPVFISETPFSGLIRMMEETSPAPLRLEGVSCMGGSADDTVKTLKFMMALSEFCILGVCEEMAGNLHQELNELVSARSGAVTSPFNEAEVWGFLAMAATQVADFPQTLRYDMLSELLRTAEQTEQAEGIKVPIGKERLGRAWAGILAMWDNAVKYDGDTKIDETQFG